MRAPVIQYSGSLQLPRGRGMAFEPASTGSRPPKVGTGLAKLDRLLGGGLPRQSLVLIGGVPGSGKTILALHMMAQAISQGGHAMLVTTTHTPVAKVRDQYSSLKFLGPTGVLERLQLFELDTGVEGATLNTLLNTIVRRIQETNVGIAVIDSFRAISDSAQNRSQVWRFLGTLSAQLVANDCVGVLVGEYALPSDLALPELAVADVVVYLEIERMVSYDLRTLRIYKLRGGSYSEGRQAFNITDDGIQLIGDQQDLPGEAQRLGELPPTPS